MRFVPPRLLVLACALVLAPAAFAQPVVDGRFLTSVSGSTLTVRVQLKTNTGTDDLGATTLRLAFNDAALNPASGAALGGFLTDGADYAYQNFDNNTDADYANATVSYPLANRIFVNIELNNDNLGTVVPTAYVDVVTLTLAITDVSAAAGLVFVAGGQEVFDGDNATLWTIGTLEANNATLPVELASFGATADGGAVVLRWATASETNNAGFHVEHRAAGDAAWTDGGFVPGAGTTTEARSYTRRVEGLGAGRHTFRLRQVDFDGTPTYSAEVEASVAMLEAVRLEAGPNPFRDRVSVRFAVREAQRVAVEVFDALGRRVATLHDGPLGAEAAAVGTFEAVGLASGVYVVRLTGERARAQRVLTLVR